MSDETAPECVILGRDASELRVVAFPRTALTDVRPALRGAGVYVLLGGQGCPHAYVGMAARVGSRMRRHDTSSLRDYWDRALVFMLPPGFAISGGRDPRVAWIEERVYGMVAPELGRAMRMRNHANFVRSYGRPLDPPEGEALAEAEAVLRDIAATLRVLGFLTGVLSDEARFSVRLAAA